MWQRFTERARRIIFFAQEEAARLGENYVGTEHMLLGLVRENDSVAARILERLGLPLGRIRSDIERQVTRGHGNLGQDMQLTPRAKRVIDLAYEEARQLNNNYIGTEHLLLGLIREGDGLASHVLVRLGADLERTRRAVYDMQERENQPSQDLGPPGTSSEPGADATARDLYLNDDALRLLELAREAVSSRGHAAVGTEHLLLALLVQGNRTVSRVLEQLDVSRDNLRRRVEQQAGSHARAISGQPQPLTWHTTRVLDRAYAEARQLQNDYLGAEHLLLALLHEGDSLAAHLLEKAGVTITPARRRLHTLQRKGEKSDERRAGRFVLTAREQAEHQRWAVVTPEHLLLAMIAEETGIAARLLQELGVALDPLRADLGPQTNSSPDEPPAQSLPGSSPPLTPRAQRAVDRACEEAGRLQSDSIGGEHLLLGLARDDESLAAQTLRGAGITPDRLLTAIEAVRTPEPGGEWRSSSTARPDPFGRERFARFTERARRVVFFAQEEAARLGENYVGTEHLLLGLVREPDNDAVHILERLGIPPGPIRADIERQVVPGKGRPGQGFQLTPRAKRVIDLADEEARQLKHNYIGTEHLLLGLIREEDGLAARVLVKHGAGLEQVRREVDAMESLEPKESSPRPGQAPRADQLDQLARAATQAPIAPGGRRQGARHAVAAARAAVEQGGRLTDLVSIQDLTAAQARALLSLAQTLKATGAGDPLAHREILPGKVLAMIFEKPSLRTRVTFETGMFQLGGHAISLQPAEIQLGQRETVADAARNLERWVDGIMARTFRHEHVVELAQYAGVPVINGLTDREHPCQALADFLTIVEKKGRAEGVKLTYIGDGNNVAHSLLLLGARLGTHITVAGPEGFEPNDEILRQAREAAAATGAQIAVTHDPAEAVRDADVVYTDVWTSMGQEAEAEERRAKFAPYQVNAELIRHAKWDAIVMHDLPAHRGEEITDEVMDGPQAAIFDQAENRLHAQKALLAVLLG